ncbi:hypothetical protein CFC21_069714, partial [Triticum aestivum]
GEQRRGGEGGGVEGGAGHGGRRRTGRRGAFLGSLVRGLQVDGRGLRQRRRLPPRALPQ